MTVPDKPQLELELLAAQKEKVLAEIAVLRKTTPITEAIKVFGSMVLGIGGAIAAFAGLQLAEVKAEKFKLQSEAAITARDTAKIEIERLKRSNVDLQLESTELNNRIAFAKVEYAAISDKIALAQQQPLSPAVTATLKDLQQNVNAADLELRASLPAVRAAGSGASLDSLLEKLYAPAAAVRGNAFEELMSRFGKSPELAPRLIAYAEQHMDNQNGVYNTLVALGRIDSKALGADTSAIKAFATKAKAIGPKTAERSDKLITRLARVSRD